MRIFKSKWFQRFARKENLDDATLKEAVDRAEQDRIDADLYGFAKNQLGNISEDEEKQFKEAAKYVLSLSEKHLAALLERGDFVEVKADEQKVSK